MWHEWSTLKKLIWLHILQGASAIIKTVTGTAPLVLTNAVNKAITELTQYGKCVQNGTPTPDAPVDIVCNNGAIKARHQSGLPLGYQLLDFIESDGKQYIDTGITDITDSEFVLDAQVVTLSSGFRTMLGAVDPTSTIAMYKVIFGDASSAGKFYSQPGVRNDGYTYGKARDTSRHIFKLTTGTASGETLSIDAESFNSGYEVTSSTIYPLYLFARNNQGAPSSYEAMRAYELKVSKSGVLILHLVPVTRISDNAVGMYDKVSDQFFTSLGTGDFTAGSPVADPVEIYTDGTPEVLTVNGQNLIDLTAVTNGYYYDPSGVYTAVSVARLTDYIPVRAGQKYTVYVKAERSGASATVRCNLFDASKAWKSQSSFTVTTGSEKVGIVTPSEDGFLRVSANYTGTGAKVDWSVLQIVFGEYTVSTMPPYQSYHAPQTVTDIPMLLSVGDTKDEGEIISGAVMHRIGCHVFDGTETFSKSTAYGKAFLINASYTSSWGADRTKAVLCSHFLGLPRTDGAKPDNTCFYNSTGHFYFRVVDNSDMDAWKAWLAEQYAAGTPVIVFFVLATETTESVTAQPLYTYAGDNTVSVTSNVDPVELEVQYSATA